jgi:hypothetical protein
VKTASSDAPAAVAPTDSAPARRRCEQTAMQLAIAAAAEQEGHLVDPETAIRVAMARQ